MHKNYCCKKKIIVIICNQSKGVEKMSVFFRKSLLGYNVEDVKKYIDGLFKKISDSDEEHKKETTKNKELILELSESLNNANQNIAELISENDKLNAEVEHYRAEKEKIVQLSEVIGKLYLVSKLNAESIITSATSIKRKTVEEAEFNMQIIEEAHLKLQDLIESVNSSSFEYTDKLNSVTESLSETKQSIQKDYRAMHRSEQKLKDVDTAVAESVKTNV